MALRLMSEFGAHRQTFGQIFVVVVGVCREENAVDYRLRTQTRFLIWPQLSETPSPN